MIEFIIAAVVAVCVLVAVIVYFKRRSPSNNDISEESAEQEIECSEPEPVVEKAVEPEPEPVVEKAVEPEPEPVVEEEPRAYIKPCASTGAVASKAAAKEPEINRDFMSKLVASKDASDRAAEIPMPRKRTTPAPAAVSVAEPVVEPVVEKAVEPEPEPVVEEEPVVSKPEPVECESKPVADVMVDPELAPSEDVAADDSTVVESVAETGDSAVDPESSEDDIYTDYSPEALVRRAAWNKGLRCRRQYGDHTIQVAFVKPKVAVYVLDPSEAIPDEDKIREEGWTILRFDMNGVTDGLSEGDVIAEAVKANLHAQKVSKKKSGKK